MTFDFCDQRLDQLKDLAKDRYDHGDSGHDFAHILRVLSWCYRLGIANEANLSILLPAALLHDVVNLPKDHPNRSQASEMAVSEARELLTRCGYDETEIEVISKSILEHSFSLGRSPSSIESAILQDADRLDAIGAIGVMRMVTCGCKMGSKYYDIDDPFAKRRDLNDKKFSMDHLEVKLFRLAEKMNTSQAREEAVRRTRFMKDFLNQIKTEIEAS